MPINQEERLLKLATPLPYNELLPKRLVAFEAVSQLFRFELELVRHETDPSAPPSIKDPKLLVGQPMTLTARQQEEGIEIERHFNGICSRLVQGSRDVDFTYYYAELVPTVWRLTQIHQSRIFQQKSVPDILKKVFAGFEVKWELSGKYEPRNYCVQYRESDFNFASRLMEEEGIYYFFEHSENAHKMVVADTPQSHKAVSKASIPFFTDRGGDTWQGTIYSWEFDDRFATGKYTLWDHTFELVGKKLEAQQVSRFDIGGNKNLEVYDWPGEYAGRFDGITPDGGEQASEIQKIFSDNKRTVAIRQQEIDVSYKAATATSDCCAIVTGGKFKLKKHPHKAYNEDYVVVSAKTVAIQHPWYISTTEAEEDPYKVSFVCLPHSVPFRPPRVTPKPTVHGSQTATVVGPAGEEIFTDKYGRVKVQFHWDREGKNNQASSCWVQAAQMWSGKKWGTMFIPRIGMEVIVDFLEGNADRPIIVGCVTNAENMPAYTLPDEKTKSYIKSNSTKGGGNFNEFRIEDKKDAEQIFVHAARDHETRVKRDQKAIILRDKHTIIDRDHFEKVKHDKHLMVTGDQVEKVDGNVHLKVGSNKEQKIGSKFAVDAGNEIHLKAGMSVTIEAGTQVTLKAGGNFVNIGPAGVSIKGTMVMINSGGAAGSGSGASPGAPKDPLEADKAEAGQVTKAPPPPPALQPPEFAALAALVRSGGAGAAAAVASALAGAQAAAESTVAKGAQAATQAAQAAKQQAAGAAAAAMAAAQTKAEEVQKKVDEVAGKLADKAAQAKALADDLKGKAQALADKAVAAAQAAKAKAEEVKKAVEDAKAAAQQKVDEAKKALEEAKQAAEQRVNEAKQALAGAQAKAQQAAAEVKDQAQQAVAQAQQKVAETQQQAEQAVQQAQQQVAQAQQQAEQAVQQAQQQAQQATQQAAQQAQQQAEQAAQQAGQAAQQVSQQAGQAIQSAQNAIPFG